MNLYFISLSVPPHIKEALSAQRFGIESKVPSKTDKDAVFALVRIQDSSDISNLPKLRKRLPYAWIVLVVASDWIKNRSRLTELINCRVKSDVCKNTEWSPRFWFMLQTAIDHYRSLREIKVLTREASEMHRQNQQMTDRTNSLITMIENNLQLAESVQRSLLPKFAPDIPGISLSVKYLPAKGIGGDYYDIFEFGDRKRFGFLLADSKSHGMAATLLSVLIKVRLEEMKERFHDSKSFVNFLSRELFTTGQQKMSTLNLLYGILDRASLSFDFTVAGPLFPTLIRHGTVENILISNNPPLGEIDNYRYQETRLTLKPGDTLLLHTDGLSALMPRSQLASTVSQLCKDNESIDGLSLQNELLSRIRVATETTPLTDDITLIHLSVVENVLYLARHSK